jgi:hypothetical protein
VRKVITALLADHAKVAALRARGLSWTEVANHFAGNPTISLTPDQADAWQKNGFALWVGRRRMLITANLEAFTKLRDLSAKVGDYVVRNRKEEWIGPFLRGQFPKGIRCKKR